MTAARVDEVFDLVAVALCGDPQLRTAVLEQVFADIADVRRIAELIVTTVHVAAFTLTMAATRDGIEIQAALPMLRERVRNALSPTVPEEN